MSKALKKVLDNNDIKKRFNEILGKKAPAFMSSIINVVNNNEYLKSCEPLSILNCASVAAALDLPINSNLGFAYIIPYKGKAQFQMGYKGFIQLAIRTGQYKGISVAPVYEGEIIESNRFTGVYKFDEEKKVSDKIIGHVAYFSMLSGFEKYLYMTDEELIKHGQTYSKSYKTGLWTSNPIVMKNKTVLKQLLSKYGLLSSDIQLAQMADQAVIDIKDGQYQYHYLDNPNANSVEIEDMTEEDEKRKNQEELEILKKEGKELVDGLVVDKKEKVQKKDKDLNTIKAEFVHLLSTSCNGNKKAMEDELCFLTSEENPKDGTLFGGISDIKDLGDNKKKIEGLYKKLKTRIESSTQ